MKLRRKVYVVGGHHSTFIGKYHPDFIWKKHPDFGKRENPTLEEHLATAVEGAMRKSGVDADAVQRGFVGNFVGELFANQGHLGAMMPRVEPAFNRKPFTRVEGACASGGLAVAGCVDAIQAGYDVTIAAGVEVQTTASARTGADYLARAAHYATEREIDEFTFPCMFARRAKYYKQKYGVTDEQIAHVVVKAYRQAALNPFAHMRSVGMTLEKASEAGPKNPAFLQNEEFAEHLKVTDCSQVSDGASAALIVSEEGLASLGKAPEDAVEIVSYAQATSALGKVEEYTELDNSRAAITRAYEEAGVGASDVDVAEVHDCFAITEILMYEALGLADTGEGWKLAVEGETALDGRVPVNPGGGLLAFGHPVGATGVKQVVEIYRQMKGLCGDYQMSAIPNVGVTANMGGDDRTTVVTVMRNLG